MSTSQGRPRGPVACAPDGSAASGGSTAVGIATACLDGTVRDVNGVLAGMLGADRGQLRGRSLPDILDGISACDVAALVAGGAELVCAEVLGRDVDGRARVEVTVSVVLDADGSPAHLLAVGVDVSETYRLQDRLHHEQRHDALTGLGNRRSLTERLAAGGPAALWYVDIDGFTDVNDGFGHDTGDAVLRAVAQRLQDAVADGGVYRLGSDEFAVVQHGATESADIGCVAERILRLLRPAIRVGGTAVWTSGCVGASFADGTVEPGQLMRAADAALAYAKSCGRHRWFRYDAAGLRDRITRHDLAAALPAALAADEFVLHYQPLVALPSTKVQGFEALVRWQHRDWGVVSPADFIPIAEDTEQIVPLGAWVLATACRQARRWLATDPQLYVSVNVAAAQLRHPTFADDVRVALDRAGLSPQNLQLELTETAVVTETVLATLRELADIGVRLAVDDFGTGYANLAHLGTLPVHQIKIDRSFLSESGDDGAARHTIVAAIISLAHALDLVVAAEGVERQDQADRLRTLGCDSAQGWLFGAALTTDEADRMLAGASAIA